MQIGTHARQITSRCIQQMRKMDNDAAFLVFARVDELRLQSR